MIPLLLALAVGYAHPEQLVETDWVAAHAGDANVRVVDMRMAATAYCDHGITESGAHTRPGSVAADPRVIPLGSKIRVEGLEGAPDGTYTVLDTGRAIKGHEIDLFLPRCAAAKKFGRQHVRVKILTRGTSTANP